MIFIQHNQLPCSYSLLSIDDYTISLVQQRWYREVNMKHSINIHNPQTEKGE